MKLSETAGHSSCSRALQVSKTHASKVVFSSNMFVVVVIAAVAATAAAVLTVSSLSYSWGHGTIWPYKSHISRSHLVHSQMKRQTT